MTAIRRLDPLASLVAALGMAMLSAGCMSPLESAASGGRADQVSALLQAKPRPQDRDMGLALIQASKEGNDEIVKLLLDAGADADFGNQDTGWSPLTIAAANQHPSTVKLLLDRGAKSEGMPEFLDKYGHPDGARLLRRLASGAPAAADRALGAGPADIQRTPAGTPSTDMDGSRRSRPESQLRLAVLEFDVAPGIKIDRMVFSDLARSAVNSRAPALFVMTRESTEALLQANGKTMSDCTGECEIEIGRKLGADFIVSGRIAQVGKRLFLTMRLFSTADGRLLQSADARGTNIDELVDQADAALAKLVSTLGGGAAPATGSGP